MLPSEMNLKIRSGTVRYNNKVLVSDERFSLEENENVNLMAPAINSHKTNSFAHKPNSVIIKRQEHQSATHDDETVALILFLAGGFAIWNNFR